MGLPLALDRGGLNRVFNTVLGGGTRHQIIQWARLMDDINNLGCPLGGPD